jgi:hypothetical protein
MLKLIHALIRTMSSFSNCSSGGEDNETGVDEVDFVRGRRTRDTDELQRSGKSLNRKRKKPFELHYDSDDDDEAGETLKDLRHKTKRVHDCIEKGPIAILLDILRDLRNVTKPSTP